MAEAPQPFGAYLLVERLRGAHRTFRAVPRTPDGTAGTSGGKVALKRLGAGRGSGAAGSLPALFHPSLAAPLQLGVTDGEGFLASELVEGRSVEELLRAGPLPLAAAVRVVAEAARGIAALHRARAGGSQLVHRRLTPRTVLVTASGRVVVCGLDEALAPRPRGSRQADRERYAPAPEQLLGEPVDARTDVFALGALLCRCLGHDVSAEAPPLPWGAGLPPPLSSLIGRCCATARAERPDSVATVEETLRAWLAALPVPFGAAELAAEAGARPLFADPAADGAPGDGSELLDDGEPAPRSARAARRDSFLTRIGWAHESGEAPASAPSHGRGADEPDPAAAPTLPSAPTGRGAFVAGAAAIGTTSRPPRRRAGLAWMGACLLAVIGIGGVRYAGDDAVPLGGLALAGTTADGRPAVAGATLASVGAAGRVAEGIGAWLRVTPRGETASAGPLLLRVTRSRCRTGELEVSLRVENRSAAVLATPLAALRLGGAEGGAPVPTVEPPVDALPAGAVREVAVRAALPATRAATHFTLELPGLSLAACPEAVP